MFGNSSRFSYRNSSRSSIMNTRNIYGNFIRNFLKVLQIFLFKFFGKKFHMRSFFKASSTICFENSCGSSFRIFSTCSFYRKIYVFRRIFPIHLSRHSSQMFLWECIQKCLQEFFQKLQKKY